MVPFQQRKEPHPHHFSLSFLILECFSSLKGNADVHSIYSTVGSLSVVGACLTPRIHLFPFLFFFLFWIDGFIFVVAFCSNNNNYPVQNINASAAIVTIKILICDVLHENTIDSLVNHHVIVHYHSNIVYIYCTSDSNNWTCTNHTMPSYGTRA